MSYSNLLVHLIWPTRDFKPIMSPANKDAICLHIRQNALIKGITIHNINGWLDHMHCLISMTTGQTVETIVNLLKGESSYWARRNLDWDSKFGWEDDYVALTISTAEFKTTNDLISQQEIEHLSKSFEEEFIELKSAHRRH